MTDRDDADREYEQATRQERNRITPGPWHVVAYVDDARGPAIVSEDTPGAKYRIHSAHHGVSYTVPRLPDARAIREVPEMIRILSEIYAGKSRSTQDMRHAADRNDDVARALLARIEGEN